LSTCVLTAVALGQSQAAPERDPSAKAEPVEATREGKAADSQGVSQSTDPRQEQTQPAQTQNAQAQAEPIKAEWILAPIPMSSPTIGNGLEWAVGRVFPLNKQDKTTPASFVGVGGLWTNNGSIGIAVGGKLYLKQDKYRLTSYAGGAKINADIYGVGQAAGDRGLFLPLTGKGLGVMGEFLFRIRKDMYLGPRVQYRNLTLELNREEVDIPDIDNPPEKLQDILDELREDLFHQKTVPIGPRFQWDTRDNTFYPRKGFYLDSGIDLFSENVGSVRTYQYYKIAFNKYISIGKQQVIAVRGMGCAAGGDRVPIYDLCLFGSNSDVRGYPTGRYQDRRMFATQAEYRLMLPIRGFFGRFGVVAVGGFGGVAKKFSDIAWGDLLPAGGGGIRFRLTKTHPINFRIDYAIGRVDQTLTLSVGEAL
jgi:hypothetical protein